jgi:hypothetical protein
MDGTRAENPRLNAGIGRSLDWEKIGRSPGLIGRSPGLEEEQEGLGLLE